MQLDPRRWNVAAQVAEKLKTVAYTTLPVEERRKKIQVLYEVHTWHSLVMVCVIRVYYEVHTWHSLVCVMQVHYEVHTWHYEYDI